MNEQPNDDDVLLIDYYLKRLDATAARKVEERIASDAEFAELHESLQHTFGALNLIPEYTPPSDLVERTMTRIRQVQQTNALIAREEIGRSLSRPTFSLREAAAIAAAVLLVATLFVPSVRQARHFAQAGQCASNLGQIGSSMMTFANGQNGGLPGAGSDSVRWLPGRDPSAASNSSGLFRLVSGGYAAPVVFICPAADGGTNFTPSPDMADFPSAGTIHYSYQHMVGHRRMSIGDPVYASRAGEMVILADQTPFYRAGAFKTEEVNNAISENHQREGQNVLFLDMHVGWVTKPCVGVGGDNIFIAGHILDYQGDERPVSPIDSFLLPAYSSATR